MNEKIVKIVYSLKFIQLWKDEHTFIEIFQCSSYGINLFKNFSFKCYNGNKIGISNCLGTEEEMGGLLTALLEDCWVGGLLTTLLGDCWMEGLLPTRLGDRDESLEWGPLSALDLANLFIRGSSLLWGGDILSKIITIIF